MSFKNSLSKSRRITVAFLIIISICSLFFLSCSKEDLSIPESLKLLMTNDGDCTCGPFIDKYEWKNKIVYLYSCNGIACNCVTWYYDEMGVQFTMDSGYTPDDFKNDSRFLNNVWACK